MATAASRWAAALGWAATLGAGASAACQPTASGSGDPPPPPSAAETSAPAAPEPPADVWALAEAGCPGSGAVFVFVAPARPAPGDTLRVVAISEEPVARAGMSVRAPNGQTRDLEGTGRGGPPFSFYAEVSGATEGAHRIVFHDGRRDILGCHDVTVEPDDEKRRPGPGGGAWRVQREWDRPMENLFSTWVEMLFDDPLAEQPAWPALHEVTRQAKRNLLHNYLGHGEDEPTALKMDPDCADLPYFLRAYFAFKLGLPFAYSSCTRGGGDQPPTCRRRFDNTEPVESRRRSVVDVMNTFLRVHIKDTVHSGTGRTAAEDDTTDYYPIPLTREAVRPGTVYADPYGHLLVVVKRLPQTQDAAGVLLAVDGQPDGTVARRRYWRGNFLFNLSEPAMGSPGFKRFRPVRSEGPRLVPLDNAAILRDPAYGDFSLTQYAGGVDGFYDAMDDLLSPDPLDPERALLELVQALEEQVEGRVLSVRNGEDHLRSGAGRIDMPDGAAIFETTGAWENFSTPSRDLRLLIAIDVVRRFPERVRRRPQRYAMPPGKKPDEVAAALEARLSQELGKRTFAYERSDGREQTLTLADVLARAEALEMAYNPNDCIEIRWAAPPDSEEIETCRRHAPPDQRAKMRKYRRWFAERTRPARE